MKCHPDTTDDDESEEPLNQTVSKQDCKNDIPTQEIEKGSSAIILILSVIILLISIVGIRYTWTSPMKRSDNELQTFVNLWRSQFPNQDEKLWGVIESQIEEYLQVYSTAPLTFVMVYKDADKTAKLLAGEVSSIAIKLKHKYEICGDTDEHKLKGNDPAITEGYLLETKLPNITNCKRLIIYNIEKLPPSAAADLHSLLDPDYPNVHSAVYIFTLKVTEKIIPRLYHLVTDVLIKQWGSGLEPDRLEPLLSRFSNFVKIEREEYDQW